MEITLLGAIIHLTDTGAIPPIKRTHGGGVYVPVEARQEYRVRTCPVGCDLRVWAPQPLSDAILVSFGIIVITGSDTLLLCSARGVPTAVDASATFVSVTPLYYLRAVLL